MTITEVGCMGVKPGLNIMNQVTWEGQILTNTWKTVIAKPGGPYRVYWGLEMDNTSRVWAFFDWDSVEQHQKFAQSHGAEAVKHLPEICTHGEFTKHLTMVPSSDVLRSPLIEVLLTYFTADITRSDKAEASVNLETILAKTFAGCSSVQKLAHGWGLQNDFPVRGKEEQLGSILVAFVGWDSVGAQTEFYESDAYNKGVELIKNMKGNIGFYSFRMNCQHLERH
ncbi:hypothetical protein BGZ63DRAFT_365110 [Mariannaea sp. PMI_226]|nr:hypothetical protein BGZ63DRAFT_365110 [Mariannaea sp. PMI_226]